MLGTLARWLRLLGFDTLFSKGKISDDELLKLAKAEGRALITRDKLLAHFARKNRLPLVQINSTELEEQLLEVTKGLKIKLDKDHFLTRCSLCNERIRKLTKAEVEKAFSQKLIPEGAYNSANEFWFCEECRKYYWVGSHWRRIEERIKRIEEHLNRGC
jgi:hypothetical protein